MKSNIRIEYDVDTQDIEYAEKTLTKLKDAIAMVNSQRIEIPIKVINKNETLWQHFKRVIWNST